MKSFGTGVWSLTLPDFWEIEQTEDAVLFFNPEASGNLLISTVVEKETITDDYIVTLLEEHSHSDAMFDEVEYGKYDGVVCCYASEDDYWCEWYLRSGNIMLFITYDCPLEDEGKEDDMVETILESLI